MRKGKKREEEELEKKERVDNKRKGLEEEGRTDEIKRRKAREGCGI